MRTTSFGTHEQAVTAAARAGAGTIIRGGVARGAPSRQRWIRILLGLRRDDHPDMHATTVGTLNPHHLAENVRAAEAGPLTPDVYAEAKRRLAGAGEEPASF